MSDNFEINKGFYFNVMRMYLHLQDDTRFIGGDLSDNVKEGIMYAVDKMCLSETDRNIIVASVGHLSQREEIAALLNIPERDVTVTLNRFRKSVACTPYYMYLLRGTLEGERHLDYVKDIINKQQNIMKQGGYGDFISEIMNWDVRLLQLYCLSEDSADRCLKNELYRIRDLWDAINGEQEEFRKIIRDKAERAAVIRFFDSLHMREQYNQR